MWQKLILHILQLDVTSVHNAVFEAAAANDC